MRLPFSPTSRRRPSARRAVARVLAALLLAAVPVVAASAAHADPCGAGGNAVACENTKPGTPFSDWFVETSYGDIDGFATQMSVQPGGTLKFKVNTPSTNYEVDIIRVGWYGGDGGRQVATLSPSAPLPQTQPNCLYDNTSGMTDCGNWNVSASWQVPATAVPGFYVANFIRDDQAGASEYPFVVSSPTSHSDIAVQTDDQTWEAYNDYGGNSLYVGTFPNSSDNRAYKVSYNRPFDNSGTENFANAELPLIEFVERNGYDVSYLTGVDVSQNPALIKNHKVFVSSGHDEYWNEQQRDGVEAARKAGVNMMFLSGNEVFWKTRFENAIDGSNTPYRTLVSYKETKVEQKIDPNQEWTGSWRDPSLSPPYDGGRPENALTGTLFDVNGYRADAIQIPASYKQDRIWRNTSVATSNSTTTLPAGTLGYEWDGDPDNGFRPPGTVDLSSTTVNITTGQYVLSDYGNTYGTGTVTHNLVMYRDTTSDALVFGAGTVQWSWGLDSQHIFPPGAPASAPTSPVVQQATVNVLADMGVQPTTLMAGLVPATQSTDTTAPAVTVTSPAPGSTVHAGSSVTVSGTATDSGGGAVGAVEYSVDGGGTWHRANGLGNWSFTWQPSKVGPASVRVRAANDSAYLSAPTTTNYTVGPQQCPCTVFGSLAPTKSDSGEAANITLGMKVTPSVDGTISAVRFYKSAANTGTHTGTLYSAAGQVLATGTFSGESASGWQTLTFSSPVPVSGGQTYVAAYNTTAGHYAADSGYFTNAGAGSLPFTAPSNSAAGGQSVYHYGAGFPTDSFGATNYWVDAVFNATGGSTPPAVTGVSPSSGATNAYTDALVSTTFNEPVASQNVAFSLKQGSTAVAGSAAVNGSTITFTPTSLLAPNTAYTATVNAVDGWGNAMSAPYTWSFTTGTSPAPCPCQLFGQSVPKQIDTGDASNVELGMKFSTSVTSVVTGLRFYKSAANTGTHTGSLWSASGQLLATGTFSGESATGWQTLTFGSPVQISANATYVVSYHTTTGHYSADSGYFASQGAGRGILTAPSSPAGGGNGVYNYGGGFPSSTFNSTNYWVDPMVDTVGVDTDAPVVTSTSPVSGAIGVSTAAGVTATWGEAMNPNSVQFTLNSSAGAVTGTVRMSPDGTTATFASTSPLAANTTYTATVDASDVVGNAMVSPYSWNFTTGAAGTCPCSVFRPTDQPASSASDSPLELGMRFTATANGSITGVRFYKAAGDTGTHTGTLWSASGQALATGTFSGESGSGWQTLTFAQPVTVTAGTGYVVSYHSSAGVYGYTTQYFTTDKVSGPLTAPAEAAGSANGVYAYGSGGTFPTGDGGGTNYWVDVVFTN
jgi:Domain of unknown function (DUF4082)/Bacterial Ig-like domain/Bacterial Ig domain